MNKTITFGPIGAIYRGQVRHAAFILGLKVEEENGFLDSMFRISGDAVKIRRMREYMNSLASQVAAMERLEAEEERQRKAAKRWWKPQTWFD